MTDTNSYIALNSAKLDLSRDGDVSAEVQLIPYGHFSGRDGRRFSMLDADRVIDNTTRRFHPNTAANTLDLVVDYEHQTFLSGKNGQPAPAGGWIKRLINKGEEGLWGVIEWTAKAREQIKNREYRYLSPVFTHDKEGNVLALKCAGLTNYPNLELKAFNKLEDNNFNNQTEDKVDLLQKLCQLLEIPENSSQEAIFAEVEKLKAGKTGAGDTSLNKIAEALGVSAADTESIVTAINKAKTETIGIAEYMALNKEVEDLKSDLIDTAVNKAVSDGVLLPALKEHARDIYKNQGRAAFDDFINKLPTVALNKSEAPAGTPPSSGASLTAEAVAVCRQLGLSEDDYRNALKEEENAHASI